MEPIIAALAPIKVPNNAPPTGLAKATVVAKKRIIAVPQSTRDGMTTSPALA